MRKSYRCIKYKEPRHTRLRLRTTEIFYGLELSNSYVNDPCENQEKQNLSKTFFLQYGENKVIHSRY